jgi:acyl carrier protein phosphodiesterase
MTNTPIQISTDLKEYLDKFDQKLDRMDAKFEQRFDKMERKFDSLQNKHLEVYPKCLLILALRLKGERGI